MLTLLKKLFWPLSYSQHVTILQPMLGLTHLVVTMFLNKLKQVRNSLQVARLLVRHWVLSGSGAIGARIANDAYRLGMKVYGYDPYVSIEAAWNSSHHVRRVSDLKEIFENCDYITVHVPLTPDTQGTFNADAFNLMQKDNYH